MSFQVFVCVVVLSAIVNEANMVKQQREKRHTSLGRKLLCNLALSLFFLFYDGIIICSYVYNSNLDFIVLFFFCLEIMLSRYICVLTLKLEINTPCARVNSTARSHLS